MQDTIVVAGGGHAAAQVVDSLRRDGYAGRLVMACGEPALPYQRPPLSKKFLGGELDVERLPIRHGAYYESIHCELVLGNPVVGIDAGARKVKLSDGGSLDYDKLVLAIGGHARPLPVPGADLPGVHVLRTMADVEAIRARIQPGVGFGGHASQAKPQSCGRRISGCVADLMKAGRGRHGNITGGPHFRSHGKPR